MNLQIVYLLQYENYYNRKQPRPKATIGEYGDYILYSQEYMNFNPNDQVNAELIMNTIEKDANYAIICNDDGTIASRWYVIGSVRLAGGQWRFTLRRDLIADFYDDILYAPATIHRGKLRDNDPYILNDEGILFNQIKQSETLLKDETQIPWIVGYIAAPQANETDEVVSVVRRDVTPDFTVETLESWNYVNYIGESNAEGSKTESNFTYYVRAQDDAVVGGYQYKFEYGAKTNNQVDYIGNPLLGATLRFNGGNQLDRFVNRDLEVAFNNKRVDLGNVAKEFVVSGNDVTVANLKALEDKILLIGTEDFRRIKVRKKRVEDANKRITSASYPDMYGALSNFALNTPLPTNTEQKLFNGYANDNSFELTVKQNVYWLELVSLELGVKISKSRNILRDAPYCMFAIPYGEIQLNGNTIGSKAIGDQISSAIAEQLGSKVYDIQLLPYCPLRKNISTSATNTIVINDSDLINYDYDNITTTGEGRVSILFWARESQFTFNIEDNRSLPRSRKTVNQCYMSRLCSPNYASIYEFSLAKNNGLAGFNVDCAYKPFSPYIHVYPRPPVGSFYGRDFDDPRGLICNGDFSMPRTTDQWQQYELNNKNYQNMFNRQIQTMSLTHEIQRTQQVIGAAVGTAQSGMTALGAAGFATGYNPVAMIGSTIVGAGGSAIAGAADVIMGDRLRANEWNQAWDTFRMSNENIQAMPDTLTKVSAFNPNNKIFPVYEEYVATTREIAAFENYIKYQGMKVGRVGTIKEFEYEDEQFVSATIIRFSDSLEANAYIAAEINNELSKGVYIKQ